MLQELFDAHDDDADIATAATTTANVFKKYFFFFKFIISLLLYLWMYECWFLLFTFTSFKFIFQCGFLDLRNIFLIFLIACLFVSWSAIVCVCRIWYSNLRIQYSLWINDGLKRLLDIFKTIHTYIHIIYEYCYIKTRTHAQSIQTKLSEFQKNNKFVGF